MHYYHGDQLGSTSLITDANGVVEETTKYYPYGGVRSGGNATKYLYNGKELLKTTGLYDYGARQYNPATMHFIEPDTVLQNPYDPQMLNRYSYVRNNPLKYIDPTGEVAKLTIDDDKKTMTIEANIYIYGKGASKDVAKEMQTTINDAWSGQTYTEYDNSIEIKDFSEDMSYRSHVNPDLRTGVWSPKSVMQWCDPGYVYAHETGHLFGLRDRYTDVIIPFINLNLGSLPDTDLGSFPNYWTTLMGGPPYINQGASGKDTSNLVTSSYKDHTDKGKVVTTHKIGLPYKWED
jgi:RHS repeat-associated protein